MDIQEYTVDFINQLIHFKLEYDVSEYLSEKATSNFREFVVEQHEEYPIKGCGLIATRELVAKWKPGKDNLLHLYEDLAPEDTGSETDSFPRDTVSIVYIFSLLEGYGNAVSDYLNPDYKRNRRAWHHGVYGDANLDDPNVIKKMIDNFCKPFNFDPAGIPEEIIKALVGLKKERNTIVHDLTRSNYFIESLDSVMAIICCIYFSSDHAQSEIKIYPWYDFEDKF